VVAVLLRSRGARWGAWAVFGLLFGVVFALPLLVIVAASFSSTWNGVLPSSLTLRNYALDGDSLTALRTSVLTSVAASLAALLVGGWAALAAHRLPRPLRAVVEAVFVLPVAVPTVVTGLALLVAFSQRPILLNGTPWIVIVAHVVLVTSFAYQAIAAAVRRLDPAYEQVAASLGAAPWYTLLRVRLPLLLPALNAAFGLCFALSMGELAATIMIYPPNWTTLPVQIFGLTDRGALFLGAALTVVLLGTTLLVLAVGARLRTAARFR
jgi:2-aminoethylphosphonate transport system permease protein